ncbi:MAG: transposase, partial [Candidatus Levybacteria bacterium]|nr:transposase [Candidatus Levybacteria bacterium]
NMSDGNARKIYLDNSYYHIYNRGVEKRLIFLDLQDYNVFLSYLKEYLLPKDEKKLNDRFSDPNISYKEKAKILKLLHLNNFAEEITFLAYCLMPNHFHFFVKQKNALSIDKFMNSLGTRYTKYFNAKYKRVGALCQGVYKAVLVNNENQFIYLTKYIHKQALARTSGGGWEARQPSSYPEFLGKRNNEWLHPKEILSFFSKTNPALSYKSFVEETNELGNMQDITDEDYTC